MQLNKIKNKLENFTKALRNESCLPSGQSDLVHIIYLNQMKILINF